MVEVTWKSFMELDRVLPHVFEVSEGKLFYPHFTDEETALCRTTRQ